MVRSYINSRFPTQRQIQIIEVNTSIIVLLQQRLTEVNHPDHTLITYPNLGHAFYHSSQWFISAGPIPQYVLADLYAWLEAHSGLSYSYVNTIAASTSAQIPISRTIQVI
ncbi:MAG: hypothetical protein WAM14_05485 [Candidatus Nitrosopolaris sp.]